VIAIIAVLVGFHLPAVHSARESSRRSSCTNNLKQPAFGCLSYENSQGYFISSGWAWRVLPLIEQQAIFEMGTDGSVRPISYGIQPAVRNRLCNRADGQLLDLDGL
jgi:hypothetical protein